MPMIPRMAHSSKELNALSRKLTDFANSYDLAADRDIIVKCFDPSDTHGWRKMPAIWHLYGGTTICINMGKLYEAIATNPMFKASAVDYHGKGYTTPAYSPKDRADGMRIRVDADGNKAYVASQKSIDQLVDQLESYLDPKKQQKNVHKTFLKKKLNPQPVEVKHPPLKNRIESGWSVYGGNPTNLLYNALVGAVMRESAYSVFHQPVLKTSWYKTATNYQKNIVHVLEELRVESQQIQRLNNDPMGAARRFLRGAVPITANARAIIADMTQKITNSAGETGLSVANIALNSSLILGRVHISTLLKFETKAISETVEEFVGADRLKAMHNIWAEYSDITDPESPRLLELVETWQGLFPSKSDGSGAGSSVAPGATGAPGSGTGGDPATGDGSSAASGGSTEGDDGEGEGEDGKAGGDGTEDDESGEGDSGADALKKVDKEDGTSTDGTGKMDGTSGPSQKGGYTGARGGHVGTPDADPDADDPGTTDEVIDTSSKELEAAAEEENLDPIGNVEYEEQDYGPKDLTPSRKSFDMSKQRKPSKDKASALASGREIEPSASSYRMASELSRALENLNVTDRGKFVTNQVTPPGRMRSRAAVQQAAEKSLKLPPTARPWARVTRTVDLNPPLTIGVMTDVSGSQGWAEKISANLAWILSHAVSKINGRVACVTFGTGITITLRPGEKMENAQVVRADDGGELFDNGMGALDSMLNLVNGTGTRIVFALTDGHFGMGNEMEKTAAWVDLLTSRGVHVVWVTPDETCEKPVEQRAISWNGSLPYTPKGVIPISAEALQDARYDGGSKVEQETAKLITKIGAQVQMSVRAARQH